MENPELYPLTENIKTLEDVLQDVDKKMIFTITDKHRLPDTDNTVMALAHKMGRMQQYFKVIISELIKLKNPS